MTKRKACAKPGCPNTHTNKGSYCDDHKPKQTDDRPNSAKRGYGWDWRKEREKFLEDHPYCECDECRGSKHPMKSEVVDHIIPHRGDMTLFWDRSNWRAMSKRHHDRKTVREDGGLGR